MTRSIETVARCTTVGDRIRFGIPGKGLFEGTVTRRGHEQGPPGSGSAVLLWLDDNAAEGPDVVLTGTHPVHLVEPVELVELRREVDTVTDERDEALALIDEVRRQDRTHLRAVTS